MLRLASLIRTQRPPWYAERSVLLHRLSHRGPNSGQMPQLATNQIDLAAVRLFEAWIKSLKP